jgi:hypothetical protein
LALLQQLARFVFQFPLHNDRAFLPVFKLEKTGNRCAHLLVVQDADRIAGPAPRCLIPFADRNGECRNRIHLKTHRSKDVALGVIGRDVADTADIVIFRRNADSLSEASEQRLFRVIHKS